LGVSFLEQKEEDADCFMKCDVLFKYVNHNCLFDSIHQLSCKWRNTYVELGYQSQYSEQAMSWRSQELGFDTPKCPTGSGAYPASCLNSSGVCLPGDKTITL